jgi:hypothetical protein
MRSRQEQIVLRQELSPLVGDSAGGGVSEGSAQAHRTGGDGECAVEGGGGALVKVLVLALERDNAIARSQVQCMSSAVYEQCSV